MAKAMGYSAARRFFLPAFDFIRRPPSRALSDEDTLREFLPLDEGIDTGAAESYPFEDF